MSSQISILNKSVRNINNLYSLNDIHKASGGEMKHQPSNFIRLDTTQGLIIEIEKDRSSDLMNAHKTVRGGRNPNLQGTWVCEELVLAYAMWISPKFHLIVLRAFLAMHRDKIKPQQDLSEITNSQQALIKKIAAEILSAMELPKIYNEQANIPFDLSENAEYRIRIKDGKVYRYKVHLSTAPYQDKKIPALKHM